MSVIMMCIYYGYNLDRKKTTCDKKHGASRKCHEENKDCPDYYPTQDFNKHREKIANLAGENL